MRKLLLLLLLSMAACTSPFQSLEPSANEVIENVTCAESQSRLYDVLYTSLVELEKIPTEADLIEVFEKALDQNSQVQINRDEFLQLVSEFYQILLKIPAKDSAELLEKLTALEVGDQTTIEAQSSQNELRAFQKKWNAFTAAQDVECPSITPPVSGPPSQINGLVYGGRKVLGTAYQSCAVLEKGPLTAETRDIDGISIVGTHSDGVGSKRKITDLQALLETNYYLQNLGQSSSCKDIRNNPLIYDYGGKPYATAADNSSLNLFKNSGSGTSALGIDCSGYVFAAIAAGGLKLHPTKKLKAISVSGINARMYMDPENNGMPCFEKVVMGVSGTLKAGDVVAISGHVQLIDSVGSDPLGVFSVQSADQCSSLTYRDFDFTIAQSSPSKNGIGINKFDGADYSAETPAIRNGFEKYAREACKARFKNKDMKIVSSTFQIIRHKQTAACLDKPIAIDGESCVATCPSLASAAHLTSN